MLNARNTLRFLAVALLLAALLLWGDDARTLSMYERERGGMLLASESEIERRNQNAFAVILGQVRADAASLMFTTTERYLHAGVAYQPHINLTELGRSGEVVAKDPHSAAGHDCAEHAGEEDAHGEDDDHPPGCEHGGVPTVIPESEQDFRGFLGDLEREVKPWIDPSLPHRHGSGDELLPWYRLMTLSNPRFIRGYLIGAMWLANRDDYSVALDFLDEGITHNDGNPELFRLYLSKATIHARTRFEAEHEQSWLGDALATAQEAYDLACAARPENGEVGVRKSGLEWTVDLEDEFRMAGRYVVIFHRDLGQLQQGLDAVSHFLQLAPDDGPAKNLLLELSELAKSSADSLP